MEIIGGGFGLPAGKGFGFDPPNGGAEAAGGIRRLGTGHRLSFHLKTSLPEHYQKRK
ncbi:MAG: hypothetical protein Q8K65_00340 [Alphaproteobacteria bacterium]|nr:hypothetical protein [Alphaproteobacteria bacterium]